MLRTPFRKKGAAAVNSVKLLDSGDCGNTFESKLRAQRENTFKVSTALGDSNAELG